MPALVLLTGVGPLATDTYIAALPALRRSLHTSAFVAQLTLTAFIVGLAVGQLFLGAISDSRGRRRLLLAGAALFTVLSGVCAVAPSGQILVAARLGQGIAAGSGVVIGRAAVTDTHQGAAAAARFGTLASITFLGPILAPAVGGFILAHGTWRTVFAALTGFGAVMVVTALVAVPETLPERHRQAPGFRHTGARMADLLRDWSFMKHVAANCLTTAGYFTYIGGSAFVLQTAYSVSPSRYAVIFATNAAALAAAAVAFRALVARVDTARLRAVGVTVSTLAAFGLTVTAIADPQGRALLAVPWTLLCLLVAGMGLTIPAMTALAQEAGRRSPGTAASLKGGMTLLTGALVTPLTGVVGYDSLLPLAVLMTVFFSAAFALTCVIDRVSSPRCR